MIVTGCFIACSPRRNTMPPPPACLAHLHAPISSASQLSAVLCARVVQYSPVMDPGADENIGCILILPAQTRHVCFVGWWNSCTTGQALGILCPVPKSGATTVTTCCDGTTPPGCGCGCGRRVQLIVVVAKDVQVRFRHYRSYYR